MGVNATTSVPKYTDGEILDASRLNVTNSGIPVFADATARDAGFGGTGEKVLAEGQYAYLESTNATQFYDGSSWQTVGGGLTFISSTTVGSAVSSVTVSNCFSSTYTNYRVIISNIDASLGDQVMGFQLGNSTASYYSATRFASYLGGTTEANRNNQNSAYLFSTETANDTNGSFDIFCPFLATRTTWAGIAFTYAYTTIFGGLHTVETSYSGFTLLNLNGTFTGGTIRVYGYQNS
jgi:hypothetical protein